MVSQNVNNLLKQANSLTLDERCEFLEQLNAQGASESDQSEREKMAAQLAKDGIIVTVPPPPTAEEIARFKAWRPIEMPGGPLSDDIIRDRR